ncbi:MAG: RNA polymerase sigma factor [Sphingosinicella sp.]|uniref:RNA polymerase sigma factor n=1 Tax=Sphingosinicella sp. TaxID=1917971 RepID=UPI0040377EC0
MRERRWVGMVAGKVSRLLDEYLLVSARAGDRRAFEALARRWQKKLLAHARRLLGDAEGARDAVQEGWLEIVRGLPRLRDERAFPAWAYRIVTRRCAKAIGAAVRGRNVAAELEAEAGAEAPVQESAHDHDRLRAAIRALSEEQRAAIALFHFEELSVAEVAVALDVPAGTVKTRLMHARRKLRAALGGDE